MTVFKSMDLLNVGSTITSNGLIKFLVHNFIWEYWNKVICMRNLFVGGVKAMSNLCIPNLHIYLYTDSALSSVLLTFMKSHKM